MHVLRQLHLFRLAALLAGAVLGLVSPAPAQIIVTQAGVGTVQATVSISGVRGIAGVSDTTNTAFTPGQFTSVSGDSFWGGWKYTNSWINGYSITLPPYTQNNSIQISSGGMTLTLQGSNYTGAVPVAWGDYRQERNVTTLAQQEPATHWPVYTGSFVITLPTHGQWLEWEILADHYPVGKQRCYLIPVGVISANSTSQTVYMTAEPYKAGVNATSGAYEPPLPGPCGGYYATSGQNRYTYGFISLDRSIASSVAAPSTQPTTPESDDSLDIIKATTQPFADAFHQWVSAESTKPISGFDYYGRVLLKWDQARQSTFQQAAWDAWTATEITTLNMTVFGVTWAPDVRLFVWDVGGMIDQWFAYSLGGWAAMTRTILTVMIGLSYAAAFVRLLLWISTAVNDQAEVR